MNPFRVMISELCENILVHSESISPGYVSARVMPTKQGKIAEIAIADTGVGIYGSYINGTNEEAKIRIQKGANPLEIAIDGLNSSKPIIVPGTLRSHRGFGLLIVRNLVKENRGQMLIASGSDSLHLDRYRNPPHSQNIEKSPAGTFICLVLDLSNPLPLEEIYENVTQFYVGPDRNVSSSRQSDATKPEQSAESEPHGDGLPISASGTKSRGRSSSVIEIPIKKIELRHYGTELLTRDAGTAIRADIASVLASGRNVEVSLDDVTDITPSVADEAFAKLSEIMGYSLFERRVRIAGGTQLARRLIGFVLQTRKRS